MRFPRNWKNSWLYSNLSKSELFVVAAKAIKQLLAEQEMKWD